MINATVTVVGATGQSAVVPLDWKAGSDFNVTLSVELGGGTMTYDIEGTVDNPYSGTPVWFDLPGGDAKAADLRLSLTQRVRAVRLNVTAWTSGTATMKVLQN